jgi:hypothetical protein
VPTGDRMEGQGPLHCGCVTACLLCPTACRAQKLCERRTRFYSNPYMVISVLVPDGQASLPSGQPLVACQLLCWHHTIKVNAATRHTQHAAHNGDGTHNSKQLRKQAMVIRSC